MTKVCSSVVGCSICYECFKCDIPESAVASATPCGHIYHQHCLRRWLDETCGASNTCPDCRNPIRVDQTKRIYFNYTFDDEITKRDAELEQLGAEKQTILNTVGELNRKCDELRRTLLEQEEFYHTHKERSAQNALLSRQVAFVDGQLDGILRDVVHMELKINNIEKQLNTCADNIKHCEL